jgi:hypothetical protein
MDGFFEGLERSIESRNWHATLVMALTLPDICVKASDPSRNTSGRRYAEWFETYVGPAYTRFVGASSYREEIKFLSGRDCYALRCALLHEGSSNVSGQSIREALDSFQFSTPGVNGNSNHMNRVAGKLYLMIDEFAADILAGARAWWSSLSEDEQRAAQERQIAFMSTDGDINI